MQRSRPLSTEKRRMLLLSRSWMVVVGGRPGRCLHGLPARRSRCRNRHDEKRPKTAKPARMRRPAGVCRQQQPAAPQTRSRTQAAAGQVEAASSPLPPPTIPKVALSNELRATCLVKVGDTMPEAELPDLDGKMHALDSLYGQEAHGRLRLDDGATPRSQLEAERRSARSDEGSRRAVRSKGRAGDRDRRWRSRRPAVAQEVAQAGVDVPRLLDPKGGLLRQDRHATSGCRGSFCSTPTAEFSGSTSSIPGPPAGSLCRVSGGIGGAIIGR